MSEFINPYHFVPPLSKPKHSTSKKAVCNTLVTIPTAGTAFCPEAAELLHDRYLASAENVSLTFSGRIECTLRTQSPCVFGNRHRKVKVNGTDTTLVENFQIDGKTAIAGTALKGMLSSIAEMASGSAMRVLGNHAMSIRSSMNQSRSAVGMIIEREVEDNGHPVLKRMLLPLTLPNFKWDERRTSFVPVGNSGENAIWDQLIKARPSLVRMPVYVERNIAGNLCFHSAFKVVDLAAETLQELAWDQNTRRPSANQPPNTDFTKETDRGDLLRPVKWSPVPSVKAIPAGSSAKIPGVVRSLSPPGGNKDSTFSLFVPVQSEWCTTDNRFSFGSVSDNLLLEAEQACSDFDSIVAHPLSSAVEERSATELKGQKPFKRLKRLKSDVVPRQLKQGDLVYFTPKSATEIASLSVSAIWREGVRWLWNAAENDYSLLHHPEQRPMDPRRTEVTMAEKLFGWVMEGISETDEQQPGELPNGYKGRVNVSDAVSEKLLTEVELRNPQQAPHQELNGCFPMPIQGSPKLPCPEFYFSGGTSRIRSELFDRGQTRNKIKIQGWKFYVIDPRTLGADQPKRWSTSRPGHDLKQKSWIRPVKCGTEFKFHVTFENLTREELELLCYSLKPDPKFQHRLGYGKPVGLGVVSIEPQKIELVNRVARYKVQKDLLTSSRFSTASDKSVSEWAEAYPMTINDHHKMIVLSGMPVASSVSYPVRSGRNPEEKLYEWFVENRKVNGQVTDNVNQPLKPLTPNTGIPPLRQN